MKKTSWLITILVCLLIIVGGAAVVLCPRIVFPFPCSEVYKRYSKGNGIDATFIKDYRVNDTLCINATLLEATDTSAWNMIEKDLNVPPPPVIPAEYKNMFKQSNSFGSFVVEKDLIHVGDQKIVIQDVYIFSRNDRSICIFHDCDKNQTMAILHKKIIELKKTKTT